MSVDLRRTEDTPLTEGSDPAERPLYEPKLEQIETDLLLEAIFRHHGYDFRGYSSNSLKRRLWKRAEAEGVATISSLQDLVLHDQAAFRRLLHDLTIKVTSMFRDPSVYVAFREQVIPILRTYPFFRIWHAGCATGEEVFSMAILLQEEGLYDRCRIYATDINAAALEKARSRIFPLDRMKEYTQNYHAAGGTADFSDYYTAGYDGAAFSADLLENVVFAQHNLAMDGPFVEFNAILCRNVMIYFNRTLQNRVHQLFLSSLANFGILILGNRETTRFSMAEDLYQELDAREKIYRKL